MAAETESTNADLLADPAAPDRSVLVAEHQRAGRGRFERTWTSPPGAGLTFSVLLRPPVPIARWGWLPLVAGIALHEGVATATGVRTALKWPNDLLAADGGKLAGILAQTSGEAVVLGIGLNVHTTRAELPVDTATSLELAGALGLDRTELLAAILARLDARVADWSESQGGVAGSGLDAVYRAACATLGADVRVTLADGRLLEGRATGIDDAGRLIVLGPRGAEPIGAGDVEHVRTA